MLRLGTFLLLFLAGFVINGQNLPVSNYTTKVLLGVEKQTFEVELELTFVPPMGFSSDRLEFLIHENANLLHCEAAGLSKFEENAGSNKAKSVLLYFEQPVSQKTTIKFHYNSVLKAEDAPWGIDKITKDWIELSLNSSWLPIHSSYSLQFTANVILEIKDEVTYDVVSSGRTKKIERNKFEITNEVPQIDLVLIASPAFYKKRKRYITIYDNKQDEKKARFMTAVGKESYIWLNKTFGKVKKLPATKLVIAPRKETGYARKNFIILNDGISVKDTIGFVNFITHEFAHFWSSGANPLTVHRWLDESIAEYVAWKYIQKEYSEKAFNGFMDRVSKEASSLPPVYQQGVAQQPIHAVMYRKGVGKLHTLENIIGEKAMFSFLVAWFQIEEKETESFLSLLKTRHGENISKQFRLELSK